MKPALIYQWWNNSDKQVWEDTKNPVIPSIATIRASDPNLPIYVVDLSDVERYWGTYPRTLNFRVIHTHPKIPLRRDDKTIHTETFNLCSRPFDLDWIMGKIREDTVIFCESDIIWFRSLFPLDLESDKFCFNAFNSGFFHYQPKMPIVRDFFLHWKHLILTGMISQDRRNDILKKYPWPVFQDETCMVYINQVMPHLVHTISQLDNLFFNPYLGFKDEYDNTKNYHFVGGLWGKNRGRAALLLRPSFDRMKSVLSDRDMAMLFGKDYADYGGQYGFRDLVEVNKLLSRTMGNPSGDSNCHFQMMV